MAQPPSSAPAGPGPAAEPDPSMDDILASIRRILSDEDKAAKPPTEGVLVLDPSMMVEEGQNPSATVSETPGSNAGQPEAATASELMDASAHGHSAAPTEVQPEIGLPVLALTDDTIGSPAPPSVARAAPAATVPTLVAPAAAEAAANSVGALMRTLAAERSAAVSRGVVTIEDLVREEIRPLLKAWLDNHLPPLVERLVQAEIERVVGRSTG